MIGQVGPCGAERLERIGPRLAFAAILFWLAAGAGADPRRTVRPRELPSRPATEVSSVPAAQGAWTGWRGNPQHSGFQRLPGKITAPAVRWRFRLGGGLDPSQAVLCSAPGNSGGDLLVIAPPGRIAAYRLDGTFLWEQRTTVGLTLLGCTDLGGDGRLRVLGGSSGLSGSKLHVFDAASGRLAWSSVPGRGSIGTVKLGPVEASGRAMYWLAAASSTPHAYYFSRGGDTPQLLWQTDLHDFISDPYSSSSIAVIESPGGARKLAVSGARGAIPTIVLDAMTGIEISRAQFFSDGEDHGFESGGPGQLLYVGTDAGLGPQLVTVSSYPSGSSYMFQGITVWYRLRRQQGTDLSIRFPSDCATCRVLCRISTATAGPIFSFRVSSPSVAGTSSFSSTDRVLLRRRSSRISASRASSAMPMER